VDEPSASRDQAAPPEETEQFRTTVPTEIRNASFPVSVRGYDRHAVNAYVLRVNRVIAELEVSRSPQAAVRHAVDRVSEQTKAILQEARESAEKITDTARDEAEQIIAQAQAEAAAQRQQAEEELAELHSQAEERMRELQADTDTVWQQRDGLLEEIQGMAGRLQEAAREAAARVPAPETEPAEPAANDGAPTVVTLPPKTD
jgi:cell division initiation protein